MAFAALSSLFANGYTINDQWFILANGRYITGHGFPHVNPFYSYGGSMVVENWLWSVICWTMWHAFGDAQTGLWLLGMLVTVGVSAASYVVAMAVTHGRVLASTVSAVMVETALLRLCSIRPALVSDLLILASVIVMLMFMQSRKAWLLVLLPVITLIDFNMHMPIAIYTVLCPGALMLADVVLSKRGRGRLIGEYSAAVTACVASAFINPWGASALAFVRNAMGVINYRDASVETRNIITTIRLWDQPGHESSAMAGPVMLGALMLVLVTASLARRSMILRRLPARNGEYDRATLLGSALIVVGLTATMLLAVRESVTFVVVLPMTVPWLFDGVDRVIALIIAGGVIAALLISALGGYKGYLPWRIDYLDDPAFVVAREPGFSIPIMEQKLAERNIPEGSPVSTDGGAGARLVYKGYLVQDDARPELMSGKVTGVRPDHLHEQYDITFDQAAADRYVDRHAGEYRWFLYPDDSPMGRALAHDDRFRPVDALPGATLYESTAYRRE